MSELEKELLEALEACRIQLIQSGDEHEYTREALNKAWQAIVKAESQQKRGEG